MSKYKNYGVISRKYSVLALAYVFVAIVLVAITFGSFAGVFLTSDNRKKIDYSIEYKGVDDTKGKITWDFYDENEYVEELVFYDLENEDILYHYESDLDQEYHNYCDIELSDDSSYLYSLNVTFSNTKETVDWKSEPFLEI